MVDKENVHFVYMYIYIEVPITFVSMGYEQRNWPTCERNLLKATQNLQKTEKNLQENCWEKDKEIDWVKMCDCVCVF